MKRDGDRETEADNRGSSQSRPRKMGVLCWIVAACLVGAVALNAIEGDILRTGTFSVLGIYLILHHLRLPERSATWRYGSNASALVFSTLVLILLLRDLGLFL